MSKATTEKTIKSPRFDIRFNDEIAIVLDTARLSVMETDAPEMIERLKKFKLDIWKAQKSKIQGIDIEEVMKLLDQFICNFFFLP